MTAQKGQDLLLKVDTDGAGSFATVAGLRARTLAFNAASVDVTDQESAGRWHHFRCEVRGLAHELQQPKGRIIQYGCDADLGDARCTINLNQAAYRSDDGVVADLGASPRSFTASGLDGYANNWFTRGLVTWLSGANAGRPSEVKVHAKSSGVVAVSLWQRPAEDIVAGDSFRIAAGCDKQFKTCRTKFDNTRNFRGFPHVPGNDFMLSVARRADKNDGKKLNR